MKLLIPTVASIALSAASLTAVAMTNTDYYGAAASTAAAARSIVVGPNTKSVNVERGETVSIVGNGQEFVWSFDGTLPTFDLKQIAPEGAIDDTLKVYVAPSAHERPSGE